MSRPAGLALARRALATAILGVFLAAVIWWAFRRWMPLVWFGDDLDNYEGFLQGAFASNPIQSLTQSVAEKYRPVYALAMEGVFTAFGPNLRHYLYFNALLNAANGVMLAFIALRLSGSRLAAVLAATMMVASRFMLYQVTQVTGLLEGVGFLFLLAALWAIVDLHTSVQQDIGAVFRRALLVVAAGWLLIFNHERYILAIPWLAVMLWAAPSFSRLSSDARQGLLVGLLSSVVVNIGYKKFVLGAAVMVGTGGTHIAFDPAGMLDRLEQAVLSVFGLNHGPAYLAGHDVTSRLFTAIGFSALGFIALICILGFLALRRAESDATGTEKGRWPYLLPASFAALAGLLLIPPVLTIRMEQRWLVEPFALVLLSAAWCVGRIASRRLALGLFAALALASVIVDTRLKVAFPDIYMVYSAREGENIRHAVLDQGPPPAQVAIIGAPDVCGWILLNGQFFHLYAPGIKTQCVGAPDQLSPQLDKASDRPRVFAVQPDFTVKEETRQVYRLLAMRDEPKRYDLLQMFPSGVISSDVKVDTPSGKGSLLFPLQTGSGQEQSLVLLGGFSYRYEHVIVKPGDRLKFDVGMVYATKTHGRARVLVQPAHGPAVLAYETILPLRAPDQPVSLTEVAAPLGRFAGPVTITFAADSPEGDLTGQWIAFVAPRIVPGGATP